MKYTITITEVSEGEEAPELLRYSQTVDAIDMLTVINAVNSNAERRRAVRSDAGKSRPRKEDLGAATWPGKAEEVV